MAEQYVYLFDEMKASPENVILLGNKGAQLAEMTSIGLPVPPGFTITTVACNKFYEIGKKWPEGLEKQVKEKLAKLETRMGKKLGDSEKPMLVSVRSGSYVSMPGMMDTVLNLGLNEQSVQGLAKQASNERMAWDSYRRFIQMFGDVVMGVEHAKFERVLEGVKEAKGAKYDTDLKVEDLKELVSKYKEMVKQEIGKGFPSDPWEQLKMSIDAVFSSWNNKRAVAYRRINKLRNDAGTGVNIQVMVFGNRGNGSATGVGFTRNPATGEKEHYGEYLLNAQGEDVVAGIRTPEHIDDMKKELPKPYEELIKVYSLLEKHYKDLQDFEFTIEEGKLYLLQTRKGKRTAQAAVKIVVDMVKEGILTKEEAIMRIDPNQLDQLLHKQLDPIAKQKNEIIAKGLPASPGAAVGIIVFTADRAKELADDGKKVVLVRTETSPEDIEGMHAAQGMLTSRGGMTSHCAVVARGMGKCAVVGCGAVVINEGEKTIRINDLVLKEGDWLSLDGGAGEVFQGQIPTTEPEIKGEFKSLMGWVDQARKLGVRTNADTPRDAKLARDFGAEGIGLTRTEHMFFEGDRIMAVREMILADDEKGRRKALDKLLPMQKSDFIGIFKEMNGLPVTIRLLDPPLHEFLPKEDKEIEEMAKGMGIDPGKIREKVEVLHEFNPMLGFRGCRLGVVYPEISEMQVRAIIEAAIEVNKSGGKALPEIEIPVLGHLGEAKNLRALIDRLAKELIEKSGVKLEYKVGTMVELPRACLVADKLAKELDFFSFGTNDLTQTTLGFSRDDAGKFIPLYVEKGLLKEDPFQVLDQEGVGSLMKICIDLARKAKPGLEIGICGEHGGEPSSVEFCHRIGLDYVSCSPYRIPIAKLAAAQAVLREKKS